MLDWEIAKPIAAIGVVVSILIAACKFNFKFDINEWQKRKDELRKIKMQNLCPHLIISLVDEQITIDSQYVSPSGTTNWICERCGHMSYTNPHAEPESRNRWVKNLKKYKERNKKIEKLAKKWGFL